jgi:hypothetical protein
MPGTGRCSDPFHRISSAFALRVILQPNYKYGYVLPVAGDRPLADAWTYDKIGNRRSETQTGEPLPFTSDLAAGDSAPGGKRHGQATRRPPLEFPPPPGRSEL